MAEPGQAPAGVETDRPSVARLYDFFLGGHHNYAADRELGRKLLQAEPNARHIVAENRAFLGRAVSYLTQAGIEQFIDLGSGIPTQENVHEIAQRGNSEARVIYVDNDPGVIAHSRHLLRGNPLVSIISADLRNPAAIVDSSRGRPADRLQPADWPAHGHRAALRAGRSRTPTAS